MRVKTREYKRLLKCVLRHRNNSIIRRVANHAKHFYKMKTISVILAILTFGVSNGQILVNATFETGNPSQGVFGTSKLAFYPGYSCAIDSTIARKGTKCARFELRSTDPLMASGRRAELNMPTASPLNAQMRWFACRS